MAETARAGETAELIARIDALERERRRSFEDAQREADALFAQYQLSQLIASGGTLEELASAVLLELVRLADAAGGSLWIGAPEGGPIALQAIAGDARSTPVPAILADLENVRPWVAERPGARAVVLSTEPPLAVFAVWPRPDASLDEDGLRIALLARHELVVAFQGAGLREALEREREELSAIVDGATDPIIQVDGEGRISRLNPAAERLIATTSEEAIGRTCGEVLGCEISGGHVLADCPLAEVRAGGEAIAYRESAVRGANGPVRVAGSYAATALDGSTGSPARATAILRDMSAARALEELREGFVATVSHELRTPLALIRGYAESLLHLPLEPAEQRTYIERIDEATTRLVTIVDQVLDVTHLQADPLILERRPATFASIVARLRGDLEISGQAHRLAADMPEDLPLIDVDIARVGQILANLVGNALKYAADGASPVSVRARVEDGWLAVTVDDEGIGIPAEDREFVTEPFHRAWNVRESRIPGTGLGLFICRRLVEAHGGTLTVGDREDGLPGTSVRITLPLVGTEAGDG